VGNDARRAPLPRIGPPRAAFYEISGFQWDDGPSKTGGRKGGRTSVDPPRLAVEHRSERFFAFGVGRPVDAL
jgi:hypothetical protein